MKDIGFTITSNKKIADRTFEMILKCPKGAHGITAPGQFVNIRLDGYFLRRPLSVCSRTEDTVTLIYKTVGRGTELMSTYEAGRQLDVLTPLGNGFDTSASGSRPVLIGGGAGVPPMYGLCKTLREEGKSPSVILGFNNAGEVFYVEKFRALGAETTVVTADGSFGGKGLVTDAVKDMEFTCFYACGPEAMLKALDFAIDKNISGQLSFEARMGCGFGACMGCSCRTKYGNKRICKDGPVLERGEIIW